MRRFSLALLLAVSTLWAQTTVRPRATEFVWLNSVTWSDSIAQPLKVIDQSVPGWCVEIFNESASTPLPFLIATSLLQSGREVADFSRGITYTTSASAHVYQSATTINARVTGFAYIRTNYAPGLAFKIWSSTASTTERMTVVLRESDTNCATDAISWTRQSWPTESNYVSGTATALSISSAVFPGYTAEAQYVFASCSAGSATLTITSGTGGALTLFSQTVNTTPIFIPIQVDGVTGYALNFNLSSCGTGNVGTLSATWTYRE